MKRKNMSQKLFTLDDEQQRRVCLNKIEAIYKECDLQERFAPGSLGFCEMLDQVHLMSEMWDFVVESPATVIDKEGYAFASNIRKLILEFYQLMDDKIPFLKNKENHNA